MDKFKFIPHTADVQFQAFGKDIEEAFANCVLATTRIMTEDKVKGKTTKQILVKEDSLQALLYDFLEEILFFVDTEGFLVGEVKNISIQKEEKNYKLSCTVTGDNADNYEILTHIKSVTYNDMFIKQEPNQVTIQVVHDI